MPSYACCTGTVPEARGSVMYIVFLQKWNCVCSRVLRCLRSCIHGTVLVAVGVVNVTVTLAYLVGEIIKQIKGTVNQIEIGYNWYIGYAYSMKGMSTFSKRPSFFAITEALLTLCCTLEELKIKKERRKWWFKNTNGNCPCFHFSNYSSLIHPYIVKHPLY
jgi:hypothetical protein